MLSLVVHSSIPVITTSNPVDKIEVNFTIPCRNVVPIAPFVTTTIPAGTYGAFDPNKGDKGSYLWTASNFQSYLLMEWDIATQDFKDPVEVYYSTNAYPPVGILSAVLPQEENHTHIWPIVIISVGVALGLALVVAMTLITYRKKKKQELGSYTRVNTTVDEKEQEEQSLTFFQQLE